MPRSQSIERLEASMRLLVRISSSERFRRHLAASTGLELERPAIHLLALAAERSSLRLSEFAGHIGVDISTVSRQASYLESKGLVRRVQDEADARAQHLELTEAGRQALEESRAARRVLLSQLMEDWSATEVRDFADHFERFAAALDQELGERPE